MIKKYSVNVIKETELQLSDYNEVFIYNDWTIIGQSMRDKGIFYNLIEDGYDYFTYYNKEMLLNSQENINLDLAHWGYSKYCKTIEVNNISKIKEDCRSGKFIELPRKQLIENLDSKKREMLFDIFNIPENKSEAKKILILTQPLLQDIAEECITNDEEQVKYYEEIIDSYSKEEYEIYLKIHPRDKVDYRDLKDKAKFLEKNVPIEIYEMLGGYYFEIGITHSSTGLDYLSCVNEKIFIKNLRS